MPQKLSVLLPVPLNNAFDYTHSHDLPLGTVVKVSFGSRERYGITWEEAGNSGTVPKTLKPLLTIFESVRLPDVSLQFLKWVSDYTMAPRGQVLKMVLPMPEVFDIKGQELYGLAKLPERLTAQRQKVTDLFQTCAEPLPLKEISEQGGVSRAVVNSMVKEGVLACVGERAWTPPVEAPQEPPEKPDLSRISGRQRMRLPKALRLSNFRPSCWKGSQGQEKRRSISRPLIGFSKAGGRP